MTEQEESDRRQEEFLAQTKAFVEALDVDETLAQLLVAEGFSALEEVAYVEPQELLGVEGFDESLVEELQRRAQDHLGKEAAAADERRRELGVEDALADIELFNPKMLVALGEAEVKTLEDLAGCAADEITSSVDGILREFGVEEQDASAIIMSARVALGWISEDDLIADQEAAAAEVAAAEAEAAAAEGVDGEASTGEDAPVEAPADAEA